MLNYEQTQILEQAIVLLFRLRNDQSVENWEVNREREFQNELNTVLKNEQAFSLILSKRRKKIPMKYREIFNEQWFKDHTRQKPNGTFEIRCMVNKIPITGSGKDLDTAAERFITALAQRSEKVKKPNKPTARRVLFNDFAAEWFEVIKKPNVKAITYDSLLTVHKAHIIKYFRYKFIDEITAMQIQPLFTKLLEEGKARTAQNVKLILNQVFKAAIAERLITLNPMEGVKVLKHHSKNGTALTYSEEREFLQKLRTSKFFLTFALMLYGGMRRAELATLRIENRFLIVKNGKRRLSQTMTERKIPITPMLAPLLANVTTVELQQAIAYSCDQLSRAFKELCPAHHLHELRHTFITRCQECGVPREVVSVWAGHAADSTMTSTVYTHFTEEFMLSEGKKIDYYNRLKS